MNTPAPPNLCRRCRNLNLRLEAFFDQGWRCPTSLEYESIQDIFDRQGNDPERHYVPGEHIHDPKHHTDEQLSQQLPSLPVENEFDQDSILISVGSVKKKDLGHLSDMYQNSKSCSLCTLVIETAKSTGWSEDESTNDPKCTIRLMSIGQGTGVMVPGVYQTTKLTQYGRYSCDLRIGNDEVELYPIHAHSPMLEFGGRIFKEKVDFTILQKWLRTCEQTHLLCQPQKWHSNLKPPPRLRLIDVQEMCLVDASSSHRYVSLSYVWGSVLTFQTKKDLLSELYLPGGLNAFHDEIALTVQDAMRTVRGLGERYLWTDAICIVQDDPIDKAELVKEMDTVYARAILTIVTAEGTHANAGLPGIRTHSRDVPKVFEIGNGMSLLQARAPLAETLLNCPWSKRAWTYQEGILSSRQLIFTNSTVHYVCCSTTWSEDIFCSNEELPPPWVFANGTMFEFQPRLAEAQAELSEITENMQNEDTSDPLVALWSEVAESLSQRDLSFEADILFAAAGMISVLQKLFQVNSIYGFPERRLEEFLFWSPMEPGCLRQRRDADKKPIYPTWSWAGWVGEISWPENTAESYGSTVEEIDWTGLPILEDEPIPLQCNGRGNVFDDARAVARTTIRSSAMDLELPFLQFRTRTTELIISTTVEPPPWISELQPFAWSTVPRDGSPRRGTYCLSTRNRPDHVVGSVVLDSLDALPNGTVSEMTFVIVSASPYQEQQFEGTAGLVFWRVLAVRRGHVMERIGHGAVLTGEEVGWKSEEVILG